MFVHMRACLLLIHAVLNIFQVKQGILFKGKVILYVRCCVFFLKKSFNSLIRELSVQSKCDTNIYSSNSAKSKQIFFV